MRALVDVATGALRPDPERARAWLEVELRRPEYHSQSLVERVLSWLDDLWLHLTQSALDASSLSTAAGVLVAVVLVVLAGVVVGRVRAEAPAPSRARGLLGETGVSPDEHRAAALAALDAGRYSDAVVEGFRAVATRSVDRGFLEDRPGLTAHEIAEALLRVLPESRGAPVAAATFEAVFYGGRPAEAEQARRTLELDDALRTAQPQQHAAVSLRTRPAVPR